LAVALLYLDTSALTKLVVEEPETPALRAFLAERAGERLITSALGRPS
jgi:predicted nucleic acid-binding protein